MTARKRALVRFMDGLDFEPGLAEIVNVRSYADTGIGTGGDTLPSGLDKLAQRPQVAASTGSTRRASSQLSTSLPR